MISKADENLSEYAVPLLYGVAGADRRTLAQTISWSSAPEIAEVVSSCSNVGKLWRVPLPEHL